ncbi:MAG TPA: hypothetical protein PLE30_10165 [Candidatus Kapabacteria bacterium]|nr:hypothetical protein [Candidatus Kapabacteria bacterium]
MNLKETIGIFKKKSFLVSLLFAIALWLYTSFNSVYKYYTTVPFSIVLPQSRAIENDLPKTFTVSIQGTGWNLLNLNVFNNSKRIFIDWSNKDIKDSNVIITRTDFLKGIQSMEGVQVEEISPEFITIKTGKITSKKVPIINKVRIFPNGNFNLIGKIILIPDSVEISGNESLLSTINSWKTEYVEYRDITKPLRADVNLSDTLNGIVRLSRNKVDFYSDIQQLADIEVPDIEVSIKGGNLPKDSYLYPPQISIVIQSGINEIEKLDRSKIVASIDINNIINDSTGVIMPKIDLPAGFTLVRIDPALIYHYKVNKIKNLSQIQ